VTLISCPECSAQVSDAAAACPHCGHPIAPPKIQQVRVERGINMRDPVHVVGVIIAVVALLFIAIVFLSAVTAKPY
jgi:uncharacterized membrane protein YvbJ